MKGYQTRHNAMKKGGRPTKFDSKTFLKKVEKYLASRQDETEVVRDGKHSPVVRLRVKLPTIEGFARFLGVTKQTLFNWEEAYPKVAKGLELIKQEQFQRLIDEGLAGYYNPTITKLILSANHGMEEETNVKGEITHTFDEQQIQRIAERILAKGRGDSNTSSKEKSD